MTIGAGVVLSALLLGVSGCTDPGAAESPAVEPVAAAEATPTPTATPVVPAYVADQNAVALAASVHGMVAALDGFASPESKVGLEDAVTRLDLDLAAADASIGAATATATATPGTSPSPSTSTSPSPSATASTSDRVLPPGGWNQLVALDSSAVLQALDAARVHVIATSSRVLNAETPNAEQGVRDTLYLAVVEQQNTPAATADTARLVGELVAKSRAAQASQQAWVDEQARLAAQPSGSGSGDGGGGGGGGETGTGSPTFTWVDGWDAAKKELEDSVQANIEKWRAEHPLCMADGQGCTPD
ncbi:hypothetical protein [Herbiconiux solani]|uniref:hypothetical protein n=1 Tax=Herbiconiux solani TaxID=661329 RepID=UPI000826B578|nr:hypothetical protein [Herbiconiux solani]